MRPRSMELVLITGMSGSGKSVALHALEDSGFYCVDNLPPELLMDFVALQQQQAAPRVAIAMDVRSASSLPLVPEQLARLRALNLSIRTLFLDAGTDTLVRRYSETRRRHPLSQIDGSHGVGDKRRDLVEAIELERGMLDAIRAESHVIDSSMIRAAQLQAYVKALITAPSVQLTLVFESFAFKRSVPADADYVFDVRMLPNPHYERDLKHQTGRDAAVAAFLAAQPEAQHMLAQITEFLTHWLPALARDHRSYVTVAIGCTGGQHRSVYLVEQLAQHFSTDWVTLKRHRELDGA
ncbi:MAG: RNase adapter RapZ [Rhodoferax sp.]